MKPFICVLMVLLSCALPLPAQEAPSAKEQKVRELLVVTGASKLGEQLIDGMLGSLRGSATGINSEFWDAFRKEINPDEIVEMIVPVYMKHLDEKDLDELIRFYKSPTGKRFVERQPAIAAESMEAGRAWGEQIAQRALTKIRAERDREQE